MASERIALQHVRAAAGFMANSQARFDMNIAAIERRYKDVTEDQTDVIDVTTWTIIKRAKRPRPEEEDETSWFDKPLVSCTPCPPDTKRGQKKKDPDQILYEQNIRKFEQYKRRGRSQIRAEMQHNEECLSSVGFRSFNNKNPDHNFDLESVASRTERHRMSRDFPDTVSMRSGFGTVPAPKKRRVDLISLGGKEKTVDNSDAVSLRSGYGSVPNRTSRRVPFTTLSANKTAPVLPAGHFGTPLAVRRDVSNWLSQMPPTEQRVAPETDRNTRSKGRYAHVTVGERRRLEMDEQLLMETRRIKIANNPNVYDQLLESYQMMSKEELMSRLANLEMSQSRMLPCPAPQREVDDDAVSLASGFGSVPVPDSSKMQKERKRKRVSTEASRLYDSLTRFDNNYTGTRSGLGKSELRLGETPTLVKTSTASQKSNTKKKQRVSQSPKTPKESDSSVSEKLQEFKEKWQGNLENCQEQTEDVEGLCSFAKGKGLNRNRVCDVKREVCRFINLSLDTLNRKLREIKSKPKTPQVASKTPNRKRTAVAEHTDASNKKRQRSEKKQTPAPKPKKQAIRQPFVESPPNERPSSPSTSMDVYSVSGYSIRGAPPQLKRSPRQPIVPPLTNRQKGRVIREWAQDQRERCSSGDFEEDKDVRGLQRNVRQVMAGCKRRHDLKLNGY